MTEGINETHYSISVDGNDVTSKFDPHLISITIKDSDGGKSDKLDITLDDADGRIALPREGADIVAEIWRPSGGGKVTFQGKTDEPESEGSRGGGMQMTISAHSADMKNEGKAKKSKHKDDASFGETAKEWGQASGFDVKVEGDLEKIKRPYWSMGNESFFSWGQRTAKEIGATFKVRGKNAVFVPRNSGSSASGQSLQGVKATRGLNGNVINWRLSPVQNRDRYRKAKVRHYDAKEAKWKVEEVEINDEGAKADLNETVKAADKDQAKDRAKSNAEESKRGKGGGSITIDGDAAAQSQAPITISGIRAGIDGEYRITSASHTLTRGAGWITQCEVEQPQGSAGQDGRKASG